MALNFTVKKHVTKTLIKLALDTQYVFRSEGAIYQAKEVEGARRAAKEGEQMKPPMLMDVMMHETGELGVIIVPTVLESELNDAYPEAAYVGKDFAVTKHKLEGKRYATWDILEVEIEAPEGAAKEEVKKGGKKAA